MRNTQLKGELGTALEIGKRIVEIIVSILLIRYWGTVSTINNNKSSTTHPIKNTFSTILLPFFKSLLNYPFTLFQASINYLFHNSLSFLPAGLTRTVTREHYTPHMDLNLAFLSFWSDSILIITGFHLIDSILHPINPSTDTISSQG